MRLLTLLADTVLPPRETGALVRDTSFDAFAREIAPRCLGERGLTCISLFPYDRPLVEACIIEAKFHGNERAAEFLGRALREYLCESLAESAPFDILPPILIPLPLSRARLGERGYNQVERVIRAAMSNSEPLRAELNTHLLVRTRETRPQTSLKGRERSENVRGAFAAEGPCDPHRTYIVVDDVITTGHTMAAACDALTAGGAKRLLPLTLAY